MPVINVMEIIVKDLFEDFLRRYPLECSCEQCKDDILALTLNKVPVKYVSSHKGEVYVKAEYTNYQLLQDIVREFTVAAMKVNQDPRH